MNKLIITTILILCFCNSKAQFVDPGTQTQLTKLNISMDALLTSIADNVKTNIKNKTINESSNLFTKENLEFVKNIEKNLRKACSFIKKGRELKDIIDINIRIVEKIKELNGKFNTPYTTDLRNDYMNKAYKTLGNVGELVSNAKDLLVENTVRMTTEGRIEYLKGIRSDISDHERNINRMLMNVELWNEEYYDSQRKKELLEKAISKAKGQTTIK